MPNKLVYKVYKVADVGDIVRISKKTRDILNRHRRETGLSASKILEQWALHCDEDYEVEEN